jgi:hypothetical protein
MMAFVLRTPARPPLPFVQSKGSSSTGTCVLRDERSVRCRMFGYTNSHTATKIPVCGSWQCSSLCAHPHTRRSLMFTTSNGSWVSAPSSCSQTRHYAAAGTAAASTHLLVVYRSIFPVLMLPPLRLFSLLMLLLLRLFCFASLLPTFAS